MGIDESGFNKTEETIIAEGGGAQADSTQYDTVTEERNGGGDSEVEQGAEGGGATNGETVTTIAQIELAHVESQSE